MLRTGLVSITFRQFSPAQISDLGLRAGLEAIEWGGDVHVPHGDLKAAQEALRLTRAAKMEVAAYGSYFRIGHSQSDGLEFRTVLKTALVLEAPVIRVWAGQLESGAADATYRRFIADESRRICEIAAQAGVLIAYEFHSGTLADTADSTRELLEEVNHPNLRTLWQPRVGVSTPEALADLQLLLPWLAHLHVFQWDGYERRPLATGGQAWREYFRTAADAARPISALIEFVQDDSPEAFRADARALREWASSPTGS